MLRNFHMAALAKVQNQFQLFRIPLHQSLQNSLAETWAQQLEEFVEKVEEIDLDMGYTPEQHERFRLSNFTLPEPFVEINSLNIQNIDPITKHEEIMESIKAIVAFCRDSKGAEFVLFQNFTRSHVIQPGRFLLLQNNTYESAKRPGLTLDDKLSAIYAVKESKLLFQNFRVTNTFLSLASFYKEASEDEIRKILGHKALASEDTEILAVNANQWFRKRFAMLRDSGILDKYSAKEILARSKDFDVAITTKKGKIVFPADNVAAKKLLQFLNEELYRGAITETLYETNSKREAS